MEVSRVVRSAAGHGATTLLAEAVSPEVTMLTPKQSAPESDEIALGCLIAEADDEMELHVVSHNSVNHESTRSVEVADTTGDGDETGGMHGCLRSIRT